MVQAAGRYSPHIVLGLLVSMVLLFAGSEVAHARGAVVDRGFDCSFLGEDGQGVVSDPEGGKVKVHTPSGQAHMVCITTIDRTDTEDDPPRGAIVFRSGNTPGACQITAPEDDDLEDGTTSSVWTEVITPTGITILNCHGSEPEE